jgi:hypothetical protein
MAAGLNQGYAKLTLKTRTTTPVRFAFEGPLKLRISIDLDSYHAPML